MPEVPTAKEVRRVLSAMDVADRARYKKMAREGKVAEDPAEAALVATAAREELQRVKWFPIVAGVIFCIEAVRAVLTDNRAQRWTSLTIMVLVAALALRKFLGRRSAAELSRAERLNRQLAVGPDLTYNGLTGEEDEPTGHW
jgi:hypothetical protein